MSIFAFALILTATSCSGDDPDTATFSAEEFSPTGVTAETIATSFANQEEYNVECLRLAGYAYEPQEVKWLGVDLIKGKGPVEEYVDQQVHPELYSYGPGKFDSATGAYKAAPPDLQAAFDTCVQEYLTKQAAAVARVQNDVDRLYARWKNFTASTDYLGAMSAWSACVKDKGHDFATIDEATTYLNDKLVAQLPELTAAGSDPQLFKQLLDEEGAIQDAARSCWSSFLKPVLEEYNRDLVKEFGTEIKAIQDAYAGTSVS